MRRNVRILPALVVALAAMGASRAWAQDPPNQAAPAPAPAEVKIPDQAPVDPAPPDPQKLSELLKLWEKNSSRLKTLDVTMTRTDRDPAWGEDEHYEGRAILKSPNLAMLDFKKIVNGVKTPHERIVCTGTEVWQYRNATKQIFVYPLEKDVQQRALEEGPLPFLFNFQEATAKQRYHLDLVGENEKYEVLRIIPREQIDQASFSKAWVQLDRKLYLLPTRIFLLDPDGKSSKDFVLTITPQSPNAVVMAANFEGKELPGWKVVRNPGGDAKPAPGARAAQPAPAIAKPDAAAPRGQQPASKSRSSIFRRN